MSELNEAKKAYQEIMKALNKHKSICVFDVSDLERASKFHLFGLELKEVYGLDIDPRRIDSLDYVCLDEYRRIGWWGVKYCRTISWSVDGRQPEDELLYSISFPTGPYIFGDGSIFSKDYPTDFFQKFWLELKSFKPDYIDEANSVMYWKIENAKDAFNSFWGVLNKYNELNREDIKQRRIEKMKADLKQLEESK